MTNIKSPPHLKMCSFNVHGYNNGLSMIENLCDTHDIIFIQEHWLQESELYKINNINTDFNCFSISSMSKKLSSGILTGRPFGGVSIMFKKSLSSLIKILDYDHDMGKFISLNLQTNVGDLILTRVYLPCVKFSRDYIIDASVIIAHIENMLIAYPSAHHLIAGDYNFECAVGNPGFNLFEPIISAYNLVCCDFINVSKLNYTYVHESLDQHSWLDHVFITKGIEQYLICFNIIDNGANCSDHLPISCSLSIQVSNTARSTSPIHSGYKERWTKLISFLIIIVPVIYCSLLLYLVNYHIVMRVYVLIIKLLLMINIIIS